MRPLILWHILGAYFLLVWVVGVVGVVFNRTFADCYTSFEGSFALQGQQVYFPKFLRDSFRSLPGCPSPSPQVGV